MAAPISRRRWALLLLVCSISGAGALHAQPTAADDISNKQHQRAQVASLVTQLQGDIATAKNQEATLQNLVSAIDGQIGLTQAEVAAAQVQLTQIQADLVAEQGVLAQTQARLLADKQSLAEALVSAYELRSKQDGLNELLSAGDAQAFWQRWLADQRFNDAQNQMTNSVSGDEANVSHQLDLIGQEKQHQQQVLDQLNATMGRLQDQRNQREAAYEVLQKVQAADAARLAEAVAAEHQIDVQIAELQAEQAAAAAHGGGNGQFIWPESGPISQYFGCTPYYFEPYDPSCPSRHFHSGLDIAAACGTNLVAADAGIAHTYYTNWGYGRYVIVIHGNGWSSLYGHMSSIAVGNGQAVARGQLIGYEGSTGNSTGCHVHFEVRYNNVPRNPLPYLP